MCHRYMAMDLGSFKTDRTLALEPENERVQCGVARVSQVDAEPKQALARSIAGEPVREEVGSSGCLSNLPCTPSLSPGFSSPWGGDCFPVWLPSGFIAEGQ